jgi:hypothetical protein
MSRSQEFDEYVSAADVRGPKELREAVERAAKGSSTTRGGWVRRLVVSNLIRMKLMTHKQARELGLVKDKRRGK